MQKKVLQYIKDNKMLCSRPRVVVGLSGGADSVCLLLILKEACKEAGATLVAVHVNHGIRGEEANRDEAFCKRLCEENNIVFKAYKFSVPDIAKEQKLSLEEAGRMVRYQSFYEAAGENGVVAVAHHQNDQAETVLFNIARGSRLKGAVGMMPVRDRIIRPLLCVTRSEIETYLKENGVEYCTDSTNLGNDYSRNSIRNQVMPLLNEINPKATAHFADFAAGALEAESFLEEYTCSCFLEKSKNLQDKILLDIKGVHSYIVGRLIRMVFERLEVGLKDITKKHVDEIVMLSSKRVGANKHIKSGVWVENTRDGLLFYKKSEAGVIEPIEINPPTRISLDDKAYMEFDIIEWDDNKKITNEVYTKYLDYDKIKFGLQLRGWQQGDIIAINNGHHKKLKQYFVDEHVSRCKKEEALLLADGSNIVWVVGKRIGADYKITENTKRVLEVRYKGEDVWKE